LGKLKTSMVWRALQTGSRGIGQYGTVFLVGYFYAPDEFGRFSLFFAVLAFMRLVGDFGVSRSIVRFVAAARRDGRLERVLGIAASVQVLVSAIVVVTYLLVGIKPVMNLLESSGLALLLVPYLLVFLLGLFLDSVLWGLEDYPFLGRAALALHGGSLLVKAGLAAVHVPIVAVLAVDIVALLIYGIVVIALLNRRYIPLRIHAPTSLGKPDWRHEAKRFLTDSVTIGVGGLLFFLYTRVDLVILRYFRALADVGVLNIAVQTYETPLYIGTIITSVIFPKIARYNRPGEERELAAHFYRGFRLMGLLMGLAAIALFTIGSMVLDHFFAEYVGAGGLLRILAPLVVIKGLGQYCSGAFLIGSGRAHIMLWSNLVGGIANVAGDLIVVDRYGATGVVWVTIFVHSAVLFFTIAYTLALVRKLTSGPTVAGNTA